MALFETSDVYCIDQVYFSGVLPLIGSLITLLAMFGVLLAINPLIAITSLGIAPLIVLCAQHYLGSLEGDSQKVKEDEAAVLASAEEVLTARTSKTIQVTSSSTKK